MFSFGQKVSDEKKPFKPTPPVEHQFKPGNPGRPKGSRNKLSENFLRELNDDFNEHGKAAIIAMREKTPGDYCRMIAMLLPKKIEIRDTPFDKLSNEELDGLIDNARAALSASEGGGDGADDSNGAQSSGGLQTLQ